MPIEELKKTFPEDPQRCQGVGPSGQCEFRAEPGKRYCRLHATSAPANLVRRTNYDLDESEYLKKFSDRVDTLGFSADSRSLRSEIGILRATLERLLKSVEDDEGLHFRSGELIALSAKIESLEKTSLTLEKELGQLMSLDEAKQLAAELLEVLFKELDSLREADEMREAQGNDLVERLIIAEDLKDELRDLLKPIGVQSTLENIADAFGDIVSGKDTPRHKN